MALASREFRSLRKAANGAVRTNLLKMARNGEGQEEGMNGESVRKCEFCEKPYLYDSYDDKAFPNCCIKCAAKARENSRPSRKK